MSERGVIDSIKHPSVTAARTALSKKRGGISAAFLAEGPGMLLKALASGAGVSLAFFASPVESAAEQHALQEARESGVECHLVTRGVFSRIYGLPYETAVRVLGVVEAKPLTTDGALARTDSQSLILVGEQTQDPRNVGVMIRTADAYGAAFAVFSADSADPYSRPCIRSTTGSVFHVPVVLPDDLAAFLAALRQRGVQLVGTSAHARTACYDAQLTLPCAVLLGNESVGLSSAAQSLCDTVVTIPMEGSADSLNVTVAAGVLLYEVRRQQAARR